MKNKIIITILIVISFFICLETSYASYKVLYTDGSLIKETNDYNDAKNTMLNSPSNTTKSTYITKNGAIVNARYALVENNDGNFNLYLNPYDNIAYTYINGNYGKEAAFIDYDPNTDRVKIKISGFAGWTNRHNVDIKLLTGGNSNTVTVFADYSIKIRTGPSLKSSHTGKYVNKGEIHHYSETKYADGYTWYHIDSGWFAAKDHTWAKPNSGSYVTRTYYIIGDVLAHYLYLKSDKTGIYYTYPIYLGRMPSHFERNVIYYSYDGTYFYKNIFDMLDDYREDSNNRSYNKDKPYYNYFMHLPVHNKTKHTAESFNQIIKEKGYWRNKTPGVVYNMPNGEFIPNVDRGGISLLFNMGHTIIQIQEETGVNAFDIFATAVHESAFGTSKIAFGKNNLFGYGAGDGNPYVLAHSYSSPEESIRAYANAISGKWINVDDYRYFGSSAGNKIMGSNVKYASDPYWGEKKSHAMYLRDLKLGQSEFNGKTLGIIKNYDTKIYHEPSRNSKVSVVIKNKYHKIKNAPFIVFDRQVNTEGVWYKVISDASLDQYGNFIQGFTSRDTSYGYIHENDIYVANNQPTIEANDIKLGINSEYNLLNNVKAYDVEDKDISNLVDIHSTNLENTKKPGIYYVTYKVHDYQDLYAYKTVKIEVFGNTDPYIEITNSNVSQFTNFDIKKHIEVKDYEGSIISDYEVNGIIDTKTIGQYTLELNVKGAYTTKQFTIKLNVIKNNIPVIKANDYTLKINNNFNPLEIASAHDVEDGEIEVKVINNKVKKDAPGKYEVTYQATDSVGQIATKTIIVTVTNKENKEIGMYFHHLKIINNKLNLMGYAYFEGINNTLMDNTKYTLIIQDITNPNIKYYKNVERIVKTTEMPFMIHNFNNIDHTYSWFNINIDVLDVPNGDYALYLQVENDYYSGISLIRNRSYKEQVSNYQESNKYINIYNDYRLNHGNLTFNIRDYELAKKSAGTEYNQFVYISNLSWNNNTLNIRGNAFSYGMDLSLNKNVTRKIIFENINTYQIYKYDLDNIASGDYYPQLPVTDNLGKDKAWFDKNINIDLEKGTYNMYIVTSSNITDISIVTDRKYRNFSHIDKEIDGKQYKFKTLISNANLQLIVE